MRSTTFRAASSSSAMRIVYGPGRGVLWFGVGVTTAGNSSTYGSSIVTRVPPAAVAVMSARPPLRNAVP